MHLLNTFCTLNQLNYYIFKLFIGRVWFFYAGSFQAGKKLIKVMRAFVDAEDE